MPPARSAPHLRPPQPIRSSSNKHSHPNIPRQCPVKTRLIPPTAKARSSLFIKKRTHPPVKTRA
jgi:hypothetical protein